MNVKYLEVNEILSKMVYKLNSIADKAPYETFEDKKACKILEDIIERVEDSILELKYYSKNVINGTLYKLDNGKFALSQNDYLSCGYPIELYNKEYEEWEVGRIEYSDKYGGYYFYNQDAGEHRRLEEGLRVRIRK